MHLLIRSPFPSLAPARAQTLLTPPLRIALRLEGRSPDVEISLVLCDDAFIQNLNRTYRGQDKPTDVLSFAQEDADNAAHGRHASQPVLLGDIVISLPTAERQAARATWSADSEVTLLAVHGLLHLLGYDDESAEGARQMQQKTVQVLTQSRVALPEGNHPFFVEEYVQT